MYKKREILDRIIEHGIYLYIFLMFLAKGEGIRNVLIYGNFILWALTVRQRGNLYLLKEKVPLLCWLYLGSTLFSVVFSIDPLFSLHELKGNPLKFGLLFPVISTVMADEKKLEKAAIVSLITLILIVLASFYSYIFYDLEMLKPNTMLVHAWHDRFARFLCTLIPFSFILYYVWKRPGLKIVLVTSIAASVLALILSTSRTGYIGFISIIFIWTFYLSRTEGYNFKKIMSGATLILFIVVAISFYVFPDVRTRLLRTSSDISTASDRTDLWKAALYAAKERPVFGWGYGDRLFLENEPYLDTPYHKAPQQVKGPHNMYLQVLFQQGLTGLIPYTLMIMGSVVIFWRRALRTGGIGSRMLTAAVSILVANYVVHSMMATVNLKYLAVVLGLGMAAKGTDAS